MLPVMQGQAIHRFRGMGSKSILIVDDDSRICRLVSRFLVRGGFRPFVANNGHQMRRVLADEAIDLVILDLVLQDEDGLNLASEVSSKHHLPILILSVNSDIQNKVNGLRVGADDYLTKPFEGEELLARIHSILRRTRSGQDGSQKSRARFSGWELDMVSQELISPDGEITELSHFEYQALSLLISKANHPVSREEILQQAARRDWNPYDRAVDVVIGKLRKKIEADSGKPRLIKTVRSIGYQLVSTVIYDG